MGGVKGTKYLHPIHFCNIRTQKMSKLKMRKKCEKKNNFRILKNPHAYLQTILKAHVKFQKDRPKTVGDVKGTRYLLSIDFCNIRTQTSKLHGEFMSPALFLFEVFALFLFEVLKIGKLSRGPLVLYHLPKY